LARRDQRSSCARSPLDNVNSAFGRPVLATHQFYDFNNELTVRDTRADAAVHRASPHRRRYRSSRSWRPHDDSGGEISPCRLARTGERRRSP
jgi:hypothetical protein